MAFSQPSHSRQHSYHLPEASAGKPEEAIITLTEMSYKNFCGTQRPLDACMTGSAPHTAAGGKMSSTGGFSAFIKRATKFDRPHYSPIKRGLPDAFPNQFQNGCRKMPIGGDCVASPDRRFALPISEVAPCPLYYR